MRAIAAVVCIMDLEMNCHTSPKGAVAFDWTQVQKVETQTRLRLWDKLTRSHLRSTSRWYAKIKSWNSRWIKWTKPCIRPKRENKLFVIRSIKGFLSLSTNTSTRLPSFKPKLPRKTPSSTSSGYKANTWSQKRTNRRISKPLFLWLIRILMYTKLV